MKFVTNRNQIAEVFFGLSGSTAGEFMAGIRTGLGLSHHRIKSPYLPPRQTMSEAESDLRHYADKKKWTLFSEYVLENLNDGEDFEKAEVKNVKQC